MYGNFFDLFDSLAGSWSRSVKEKDGYTVKPAPNNRGYIIVFNTLGVAPEDIKVTHSPVSTSKYKSRYINNQKIEEDENRVESTYIRVCGSTKLDELNDRFSVNYEIICNNENPLEEVQYKVKDGLTIVYIKTKDNDIDGTLASQIENGGDFNW